MSAGTNPAPAAPDEPRYFFVRRPVMAAVISIVITLLGALKKYGLKRGVASLCIGGGEATALAVEML